MPEEPKQDAKIRKSVSFMVTISESIPQLLMSCLVLRSYGMSVAFVTQIFQILSIVTSSISPCFAFALVSLPLLPMEAFEKCFYFSRDKEEMV